MMKPEAFPFLRISKQFHVSYYDLLGTFTDTPTHDGYIIDTSILTNKYKMPQRQINDLYREIQAAMRIQEMVRTGKLDWQTGEVL